MRDPSIRNVHRGRALDNRARGLPWLGLAAVSFSLAEFVLYVALPVWILEQSNSTGAVGLSFILRMLPAFAGPALGAVVDRFPKRHLMTGSGVLSALLVVPVIVTVNHGQTLPIYIAILGGSASFLLFNLSRRSAIPEVIPDRNRLAWANSVMTVATSLAQVVGAGLGALVLSRLAPATVVAVAAALYLAAGVLSTRVPTRARAGAPDGPGVRADRGDPLAREGQGGRNGRAEGVEESRRTEPAGESRPASRAVVLGVVLLMGLEMLAAGPFIAYQIIYVKADMGLSPEFFGYLLSAQMAGNLLAATFLASWARKVAPGKLLPLSMGGLALSSVIFLSGAPFWVLLSRVLTGIAVSAKVVADDTLIQTHARERRLGRTFALGSAAASVAETASIAAAGWLVPHVPLATVFAVSAALQASGVVAGLRIRTLAKEAGDGNDR